MPKTILIFSDGTGQIGGVKPDERLSNVYKMYRAMRPGPDSPIDPKRQYAFYDAGLGAGETGGLTYRRLRNTLAAAVGTGIDENVIDCYAAIIAHYEPGDKICLFGFSRGAYTVRSLANVMNLCGVPTHDAGGHPVPRYGPELRKIATDAVKFVYNHGAGHPRGKFENEREEKAARFRAKYGCEGTGVDGEPQGNVQPEFIGVFDTVAALGSRDATAAAIVGVGALTLLAALAWGLLGWFAGLLIFAPLIAALIWVVRLLSGQWKYFFPDADRHPALWNPLNWPSLWQHGHLAAWSSKNYDRYVDKEIPHLRHALAIDEARAKFPRVLWGRPEDVEWNNERRNVDWMRQVWFAGDHSDIGGSYAEEEARLSDIPLQWMMEELRAAVPDIAIREGLLTTWPDPLGLQHDQRQEVLNMQPGWLRRLTSSKLTWRTKIRPVNELAMLHPSVLDRFAAAVVPQMGEVKPYRPENLRDHEAVRHFFVDTNGA